VEHPRIQWFADPAVLAPLALMVWIYVRRFLQVRRAAGAREAGAGEAGAGEAEVGEAGTSEPGAREAWAREAGAREAGAREAGTREAWAGEAEVGEAGAGEAEVGEAEVGEAGTSEAGTREAGTREAGARGSVGAVRGAGALHAIAFGGAVLALLAALVSPVDGLGADYLFSAHMVQHVLLGDIAPLLLLLSLSRVIMRPATRRLARVERALGPLASPWTAIAIWLGIMYLWHVPALYDAAAQQPLLHALEHLSFFAAGVALWWPLIQPVPMRNGLTGLQPLAYIALAKGGLAALGLFLAWSSTAHYPWYEDTPRIWGLSPVEDQNVAGVIMMVEQSLTLVLVMVWVFVRMLGRSEEEQLRRERLEDAQVAALDG
jgi:cytochrome c oxidase assembly factor CtaG